MNKTEKIKEKRKEKKSKERKTMQKQNETKQNNAKTRHKTKSKIELNRTISFNVFFTNKTTTGYSARFTKRPLIFLIIESIFIDPICYIFIHLIDLI